MKALVVSSRFPWPSHTGDRLRAAVWAQALSRRGDVTLVAPPGRVPEGAGVATHVPTRPSVGALLSGVARACVHVLPLSSLLAAGYGWRRALAAARRDHGPFDVAVVLLARTDPWVFRHLRSRRLVLDGIDSLAGNLAQRAAASRVPLRWGWLAESALTARLERDAAARYDRVLVVGEAERAGFGGNPRAVSHGVEIGPASDGERDFDVAFWGRLRYFANRDAERLLLGAVWPAVRSALPAARLLVAGAEAPRSVQRAGGRDGVTVVSPMTDRAALLRRVKVALFPVRFGTGQSNKVLEAAEASCAVVSTPAGVRGLDELAAHAIVAESPAGLAAAVLSLLRDPDEARRRGAALREAVELGFSRQRACALLASAALDE